MKIEFLWFDGCPNHEEARAVLRDVMSARGISEVVDDVDATELRVAEQHRFPGSPTIRINGKDVEPGFVDPGDYTPRCRLYATSSRLTGVPERLWIENAFDEVVNSNQENRHE